MNHFMDHYKYQQAVIQEIKNSTLDFGAFGHVSPDISNYGQKVWGCSYTDGLICDENSFE